MSLILISSTRQSNFIDKMDWKTDLYESDKYKNQSFYHRDGLIPTFYDLIMPEFGSSKPWREVMEVIEVMTDKPKVNASIYWEYFRPLEKTLKLENERNGVFVGWKAKDIGFFFPKQTIT